MSKVSAPEYDLILPQPFTGDIPEGWTSRLLAQGHQTGLPGRAAPQPPAVLMSVNPDSAASSRPGALPKDDGDSGITRGVHSAAPIRAPCPCCTRFGVLFCFPSFFTSSTYFASLPKELSSLAQDEVFAAHFLGTLAFK